MTEWILSKCEDLKINFWNVLFAVASVYDILPSKIKYNFNELPDMIKFIMNLINYLGKKLYSNGWGLIIIIIAFYIFPGFCYMFFLKIHMKRRVNFYTWPAALFLRYFWIIYLVVKEIMALHMSPIKYWFSMFPSFPSLDSLFNAMLFIFNFIVLLISLFEEFFPKYE